MSKSADKVHFLEDAFAAINGLRQQSVRVHSITNTVAQNFTANVLLACNARPSMTVNPEEIPDFVEHAGALHINLGTLDESRMEAIRIAVDHATKRNLPVLLDPVMVHVSPLRASFAREILDKVTIVRANASEVSALEIEAGHETCVVTTGERDCISFQGSCIKISNGDPVMANVIATGCALGGLIAALSARSGSPMAASLAGLAWFSAAGEIAASKSNGPGSFVPAFVDCLHNVELEEIAKRINLS